MKTDDLDALIFSYLDQTIGNDETRELEKILEKDHGARLRFAELARLDSEIRDLGVEDAAEPIPSTPSKFRSPVISYSWAAVATIALLCALVFRGSDEQANLSTAVIKSGVAVISAEAGAVWREKEINSGTNLTPGIVTLEKGLAQIDFFGGATVSLAAPAKLEIVSSEKAILHHGQLRADVPPAARGFEVFVGNYRIEDLGTKFGVTADGVNAPELVVFDGEVRAFGKSRSGDLLVTGDRGLLENGGFVANEKAGFSGYPDINSIVSSAGENEHTRYTSWKEYSMAQRSDPRLYAYYDFEDLTTTSRRLKNRAETGRGKELDGGIVSARVAEGRWPSKTALDFRREGDRVRFNMPGTFEDLTIYAWVRIDALDRVLNSLFLTDNYNENEFHWQLSREGALHFASSPHGAVDLLKHNRRFYSDRFWSPALSGEWFMLATVVKTSAGEKPVHYINGHKVGYSGGANQEKPLSSLRIGKADLGNWTDPLWSRSMRTLNGRIDEFAIYRVALSADEIKQRFEIGKP